MLGDIQSIRDTLARAAAWFVQADGGAVWNGVLLDRLDPNARAMIVTVLNGKLASLDAWLVGEWTWTETITMLDFVEKWRWEEIQIEKLRAHRELEGYLDIDQPRAWFPIPTMEIPKRKS